MRKHYLDNIRWMVQILVVIYHLFYVYSGCGFPGTVGVITRSPFVPGEIFQYLVYPWFMVILFIVAGISSRLYLDRHTHKEFIRSRTTKLLVPSSIGILVFGWIQGYISMSLSDGAMESVSAAPLPIRFLIMCLSGTSVLWFLQLLWVLSLLLVVVRKIEKDRLYTICSKANILFVILMAIPVWGAAQLLNTPIITVYRFGLYGIVFFLGYFVFSHDEVISLLKRYAILLTAIGVTFEAAFTLVYYGQPYPEAPVNLSILFCGCSWFMSIAVIALAARYLDFSNGLTSWMNKRSFGLYVFHYIGISAVGLFIAESGIMPAWCCYILSIVAGFGGGFLLNAIISRIPFLRWAVLGISKRKG